MIYPRRDRRPLDDIWRDRVLHAETAYRLAKLLSIAIRDFESTGEPVISCNCKASMRTRNGIHARPVLFHELIVNGACSPNR